MVTATLKISGREYIVVSKREYVRLQERIAELSKTRTLASKNTALEQDRRDLRIAAKRLGDPREKPIPYVRVRKELGLI